MSEAIVQPVWGSFVPFGWPPPTREEVLQAFHGLRRAPEGTPKLGSFSASAQDRSEQSRKWFETVVADDAYDEEEFFIDVTRASKAANRHMQAQRDALDS